MIITRPLIISPPVLLKKPPPAVLLPPVVTPPANVLAIRTLPIRVPPSSLGPPSIRTRGRDLDRVRECEPELVLELPRIIPRKGIAVGAGWWG